MQNVIVCVFSSFFALPWQIINFGNQRCFGFFLSLQGGEDIRDKNFVKIVMEGLLRLRLRVLIKWFYLVLFIFLSSFLILLLCVVSKIFSKKMSQKIMELTFPKQMH